jgi:hypothetical protein
LVALIPLHASTRAKTHRGACGAYEFVDKSSEFIAMTAEDASCEQRDARILHGVMGIPLRIPRGCVRRSQPQLLRRNVNCQAIVSETPV